ncbi:MAG: hypothetical protein CM15mP58_06790 [Burkholderiaceae bacterium]|nr:MAG: hypothetical protein CM15mP58_06790 [Burkholderiaceae bacterium]
MPGIRITQISDVTPVPTTVVVLQKTSYLILKGVYLWHDI